MKFKFIDRLSALALMGKACHWYADRQEETGPDGGPIPQNITVNFVETSLSPEEAYRRMVNGPTETRPVPVLRYCMQLQEESCNRPAVYEFQ